MGIPFSSGTKPTENSRPSRRDSITTDGHSVSNANSMASLRWIVFSNRVTPRLDPPLFGLTKQGILTICAISFIRDSERTSSRLISMESATKIPSALSLLFALNLLNVNRTESEDPVLKGISRVSKYFWRIPSSPGVP